MLEDIANGRRAGKIATDHHAEDDTNPADAANVAGYVLLKFAHKQTASAMNIVTPLTSVCVSKASLSMFPILENKEGTYVRRVNALEHSKDSIATGTKVHMSLPVPDEVGLSQTRKKRTTHDCKSAALQT